MPNPMASRNIRILIADDEVFIREGLQEALQKPGFAIDAVADGRQAWERLQREHYHLVILDLRMPGPGGIELLNEIGDQFPSTLSIILTAHGSISTAVEAMRKGAYEFITKPVDISHLRLLVDRAVERIELEEENRKLHHQLEHHEAFHRIVRRSPSMQAATRTLKQVAMAEIPVLLRGETGVGKELIARVLHERSRRHEGPFVAVNCGGFTEELFSSELFGHAKGAYTGAYTDRPGRFSLAGGGTLLLDEIGEVPLKNQVELLRALESHEFQPLGATAVQHADVRVIAATNRDLEDAVRQGSFREDLYYRLNVVPIDIPPLRQRHEDIPILAEMFLEESCRAQNQQRKQLGPATIECFIQHAWPGNVRELRNLIQRLVVICPQRTILPAHLPTGLGKTRDITSHIKLPLGSSLQHLETEVIRQTLERVTSNRREAAAILGISVRSLQYKIKAYELH